MILTARQIEDLHRQSGGNGRVTLPYRARLTPLASDWIRSRRITVGYGETEPVPPAPAAAKEDRSAAAILWWCDGPCGPAKAAITAQAKESALRPLDLPSDPGRLVAVIKAIAAAVRADPTVGAVLLVRNAGAAAVLVNRCPSLRGIPGTCLQTVESGIQQTAANVLILEHPNGTMQQFRNLISRFARGRRVPSEEFLRQCQELASCG